MYNRRYDISLPLIKLWLMLSFHEGNVGSFFYDTYCTEKHSRWMKIIIRPTKNWSSVYRVLPCQKKRYFYSFIILFPMHKHFLNFNLLHQYWSFPYFTQKLKKEILHCLMLTIKESITKIFIMFSLRLSTSRCRNKYLQ